MQKHLKNESITEPEIILKMLISLSLSLSLCLPVVLSSHPMATLKAVYLGWQHFKIEEAWSHCLERSCQKELPEPLQTVT